jgi:hypothetical protein
MNINERIASLRRALARTDDRATKATLQAAIAQAEASRDARRTGCSVGTQSHYARELATSAAKAVLL